MNGHEKELAKVTWRRNNAGKGINLVSARVWDTTQKEVIPI
jgi:hypothetical protein